MSSSFHEKRAVLQSCTHDFERIVEEFDTVDDYETPEDLETFVQRLQDRVEAVNFTVVDASNRMDDVNDALVFARKWSEMVHEARTKRIVLVLRRTPSNSRAILVLQRMEHVRGACNENSPLSAVVLMRGEQALYPRDELSPRTLDELAARIKSSAADCPICGDFLSTSAATQFRCGHRVHTNCFQRLCYVATRPDCPVCPPDTVVGTPVVPSADISIANMPALLYEKQLDGLTQIFAEASL